MNGRCVLKKSPVEGLVEALLFMKEEFIMEGIKNVILDLGGVIIGITWSRCIDAFAQLGVTDIRQNDVSDYLQKELFMQFELGTISPHAFRAGIRRKTEREITDEEINYAWIQMLGEVTTEKLDLLLDLHQRYNTFLLSNTNLLHWQWIASKYFNYRGLQADDFFDRIYLSYELHMQKPNTDIFQFVLEDAHIQAEETLFLDDSLANCKAAEGLKINSYNVQPREDWSHLFR